MKTILTLTLLFAQSAMAQQLAEPLQPLQFLLGAWSAPSGQGDSFKAELDGHILTRSATSTVAGMTRAMRSLLTIYASPGGQMRAIYFDDQGHTVEYDTSKLSKDQVEFTSDPSRPGPQFRLTYTKSGSDALEVKFEMSEPSHPGDFHPVAQAVESKSH